MCALAHESDARCYPTQSITEQAHSLVARITTCIALMGKSAHVLRLDIGDGVKKDLSKSANCTRPSFVGYASVVVLTFQPFVFGQRSESFLTSTSNSATVRLLHFGEMHDIHRWMR
jgi:hypothetical protein